jgi:hypothetical protein
MNDLAISIFKEFLCFNPSLVKKMKNTEQAYDGLNPNKYHLENDVWTHTCLCFNHFLNNYDIDNDDDFLISIVASVLCHDIGKCYVKDTKHEAKKCTFYGHGNASIQDTVDFISYLNDIGYISNMDYVLGLVLPAVSNHIDLYRDAKRKEQFLNGSTDLREISAVLADCDSKGSITFEFTTKKKGVDIEDFDLTGGVKEDPSLRTIYVYCGVPGVGKDYIAESTGLPIVSFDDIRLEEYRTTHLNSTWYNLSEPERYIAAFEWCNSEKIDLMKLMRKKVVNIIGDVIISNTNCNKKARRSIINSLGKANYKSVYVVSTKETIIGRDIGRETDSKTVGQDVIRRFMFNQQIPTIREGFVSSKIVFN